MNLEDICSLLQATLLTTNHNLKRVVHSAFSSDMMSDVLAFAKDDSILITGLCNPQVMRTAEMMDLAGVIFIRGKWPDETMLRLAEDMGLCVMVTELPMFHTCGKLFCAGLNGGVSPDA